jgi:Tol biopolymer transport system component
MTRFDDLDRALTAWFEDEAAAPAPAGLLERVATATASRRRRPAWSVALTNGWSAVVDRAPRAAGGSGRSSVARIILVLGLLGLLILGALLAFAGSRQQLPAPFGPAANGLIAYSQNGDIYVGNPDTGASRAIITGPAKDSAPFWSLDGTRLISVREVDGGSDLVLTDADGGHPVVLAGGPFVDPVFAAWSPTGRIFAIASKVAGKPRMWLVNTDGSGAKLVAGDLAVESFAFRPPDGNEILIRGESSDGVGLYVVDANGGNRRTIVRPDGTTPEDWDLAEARYSPDGTRIAYQHHDEAAQVTRLHIVDADGSHDRVLHMDGATFEGWPVWSPDGTRLVIIPSFSPFDQWGADAGWDVPYTIVRADGTGPAVRTGPPLPKAGAKVEWSPDGTSLLMIPFFGDKRHLLLDAMGGPAKPLPWPADTDLTWQRLPP